jgi:hypothetical protein
MQNVILHLNSFLTTTTTKILHLIFVCNPPKRISKFENYFLAGITSNTLQAGCGMVPMLKIWLDQVQPWASLQLWSFITHPSTSAKPCQPLHLLAMTLA